MLKLGFGCMRPPLTDPQDRSSIDIGAFRQLVDTYMENGFSYFDTAYRYCGGNSERSLREVLIDRYPRESYVLTTKLSNQFMKTKEEQECVFNEQFEKLGAGYFDYYLLHNQGEVNYKVTQELDSIEFIKKKKSRGW